MSTDAADLYTALVSSNRIHGLRRLTYRCDSRCLLLDAVDTPLGILMHQKRYKYSDAENKVRSNESGRAANTYDGNNHWRERTYYIEWSALSESFTGDTAASLEVTCDHVLGYPMTADQFGDDWAKELTEITLRADGSRYAVE